MLSHCMCFSFLTYLCNLVRLLKDTAIDNWCIIDKTQIIIKKGAKEATESVFGHVTKCWTQSGRSFELHRQMLLWSIMNKHTRVVTFDLCMRAQLCSGGGVENLPLLGVTELKSTQTALLFHPEVKTQKTWLMLWKRTCKLNPASPWAKEYVCIVSLWRMEVGSWWQGVFL